MENKYLLFILLGAVSLAGIMTGCSGVAAINKFATEADVPRISAQDAKAAYDSGNAVIVDSRSQANWAQEHIAGSISIPPGTGDDKFALLPKGKKIIVYCSCSHEQTSVALAFKMNQKGIPDTYALVGGTADWKGAGYPMESSPEAMPTRQNAATQPEKPLVQ